ncbi:polymorphic toxin type 15 domain-containing protein [Agrococcus sp. Marseille-P2731]|uniref:polymorphic toxin type 15 domain-containing protein n=1 Tax=Agrococcus sp. Marseille-P2731 TaxID=1841862 RepID=UPI00093165C5|nr:polymorphic toxin type 15 domain-containing protein [Agrococcus sp. Marseille-P2731]
MSQLKIITKQAVDALQEVLPQIARGVSRQSTRAKKKIVAMSKAIKDKDLELASRVRRHDVPPHRRTELDVDIPGFRNRRGYDQGEFDDQVREQLDTLQDMSMLEWIARRGRYADGGRPSASRAAQQAARDQAEIDHLTELLDAGVDYDDALAQTSSWMSSQAALHRLDGVAGGNVTDISGLGAGGINSSIGGQWSSRIRQIDIAVADFVQSNPGIDLSTVFMNVTQLP